jgi:ribonucleoside-diphosphate reductase alpha chain
MQQLDFGDFGVPSSCACEKLVEPEDGVSVTDAIHEELPANPRPPHVDRLCPPIDREGMTHRFTIWGMDARGQPRTYKGYLTINTYDDGLPCEIFVRFAKEGSRVRALLDAWAAAVSIAIQHGVPLENFIEKFIGVQFEPTGATSNPKIRSCLSPLDYICKYIQMTYFTEEEPTDE